MNFPILRIEMSENYFFLIHLSLVSIIILGVSFIHMIMSIDIYL